ncbi:MAG: hypothetical protein ACLFRR_08375 [Spirochaetaceae bacterium]
MENTLNLLSRRAGFNTALRHFKTANAFAREVQDGYNLADLINESLAEGEIARYQVRALLSALLVDKFDYAYKAHNLKETVEGVDKLVDKVSGWGRMQFVLAYHHPQAGLFVLNPKSKTQWEDTLPFMQDELIVVYAGSVDGELNDKVLRGAVDDLITLLYGGTVRDKKDYRGTGAAGAKSREAAKEEAPRHGQPAAGAAEAPPSQAPPGKKRRITPKYSVLVTNELFHNGNVEAWKKIIESYKAKYPDLDVLIWYENERINDLNSLFKWGKVKHGTPIMFSVVGEDIKGVSKLQRYLYEGASPRFEAFLKGGVGRTLDLF